ncbi:hypothetical protein [Vulcanisaeta distributa]|uniref:hypothetical protein n=1 Tax=Vulcanisaeta distributa TaxID=164451 RepID=UPI000ACF13EC|nr:hypothetical protein [Vulcanisaeta distributa]
MGGNKFVVYIGQDAIKKHPELVVKVCEVLRRIHEETVNKGDMKRVQKILKAIKYLNCPA